MNETNDNILHIVATDLLDYSFKVEQAIKQGYTFSNLNMYAPRAWPHMFEAWMLLSPKDEEGKLKAEVETTVKPSESISVASNGTSEGTDTGNETKAATGASKGVTKRGRK